MPVEGTKPEEQPEDRTCKCEAKGLPCTRRCSSKTCAKCPHCICCTSLRCHRGTRLATHHAWVDLHCNHFLGSFQQLHGQVSSSWANFEDNISALHSSLVNDGLQDQRVFEDMLAFAFQELEPCDQDW